MAACASATGAVPRDPPSNKRAAERDAERLLQRAVLPSGSVRLPTEPAGDGGLLRHPPQSSTGLLVDRHAWWRSAEGLSAMVAFIKSHPEAGSELTGWGHLGGPDVPLNRFLVFSLPAVRGVISSRQVLFWVVALRAGGTGIRIDAQDVWVERRPPTERVPVGAREIDVTSALPGKPPIVSRRVTASSRVQRIVSWVNRLPTVQPGATSCPGVSSSPPLVTLKFRLRSGRPPVAVVSATDYHYSNQCDPVSLTIRGHAQKPLIGGDFLERVQRLLGVRFR